MYVHTHRHTYIHTYIYIHAYIHTAHTYRQRQVLTCIHTERHTDRQTDAHIHTPVNGSMVNKAPSEVEAKCSISVIWNAKINIISTYKHYLFGSKKMSGVGFEPTPTTVDCNLNAAP